jgi:hypothetical protein
MMPGALTSTRRRSVGLDRALAVDRVSKSVDHAAEKARTDRNVDDRAGTLDRVAFLDVAVGAEDDDADIVGSRGSAPCRGCKCELERIEFGA